MQAREAELKYIEERNNLEIKKTTEMAEIDSKKFNAMVNSLGPDTIRAIATAGPDSQVKLLQSLGLQTALITDGKSPINLFQAANGMIGAAQDQAVGLASAASGSSKAARKRYDDDDE